MQEIMSLSQARSKNAKKYWTGIPCRHGHTDFRWTANSTCIACHAAKVEKWQHANAAKVIEIKKLHAAKPEAREKNKIASAKVRDRNPGKATAWKRANPERARALNAASAKRYPDKQAAKLAKRRSALMNATPSWADMSAISAVYAECLRKTKQSGIKHHVDHIIPLRGMNVSGLHVHYNLQVIPAHDNHVKGNRLPEALDVAA